MGDVRSLGSKALEDLGLHEEVEEQLREIQEELSDAYRDAFFEMTAAIQRQASALSRIQLTLNLLLERLAPDLVLADRIPVALQQADSQDEADLARAVVVADPIGAGYTLSQTGLSKATGLGPADISALVKAFRLTEDEACAVVVRQGKKRSLTNYHPRAVHRLLDLVKDPPEKLSKDGLQAVRRARKKLGLAPADSK